jgi:hypothetical protein
MENNNEETWIDWRGVFFFFWEVYFFFGSVVRAQENFFQNIPIAYMH